MGDIYGTAEEVLIWLGPSDDDIKELMESITEIDSKAIRAQSLGRYKDWPSLCRSFMTEELSTSLSRPDSRQRRALSELLQRPWFNRVWILQEVARAKMARIICGEDSCPARTFALMPSLIGLIVNDHTQAVLDIIPRLRKSTWWSSKHSLHELIIKFAGSRATDSRDKVYALLGISEDACDPARFYPSCEKNWYQVYRDTASFLLLGDIVDSNHSFPDITYQGLCLPLTQLGEGTLSWTLSQSEWNRESAQNTAMLLIRRLNEGHLETPNLVMSLAKKHGQVDAVQNLLSHGSVEFNIDHEANEDILRIISKRNSSESVSLVFPREQRARLSRAEQLQQVERLVRTGSTEYYYWSPEKDEDQNITETINQPIEDDVPQVEYGNF